MPMLNWVYGAKSPDIEGAVNKAIYAAHQYRNRICELELAKRERHEALLRRLAPEYVAACQAIESAEAELGEAREAIQRERTRQRTKKPQGVQHWVDAAAIAKAKLKELRAECKAAKQAAYEDSAVTAAMRENSDQYKAERAEAKAASGLYWGTEAIVSQSCASFSSGAPPRFKRFEHEGQLAVQLQGGLDCQEATSRGTLLQLIVPDDLAGMLAERGTAPRSLCRTECLFRIASDETGKPIFARVPIVFHRPLPNGKIKWAYLERRMIANRPKWSIRLTIDVQETRQPANDRLVAVHVGWRSEQQGLRVASWIGDDGRAGYLRLSHGHCDDYLHLDEVRSARDSAFNEHRDLLKDWISENANWLPDWMCETKSTMHAWKSPKRLAALVLRWRDERVYGDGDMFVTMNEWRKRDKHQWQHERRLWARIVRRRTDLYRNFAKSLSDRYGIVAIAQIDAKELVEHSTPEELERDNSLATRRAKWAAVSDLLRIIRERFPLRCIETVAAGISQQCANCGEKNKVKHRKVQCCGCGKTYDIDENGMANTLARGEAAIKSGALLEAVAAQEDKARKAQEKLHKMQEARRAARKLRVAAIG